MNMFNALKELTDELVEKSSADNRLMAVSGMSIEELTDAFTKGHRLVSPELTHEQRILEEDWIPVTKRLPDEFDRYLISTDDGMVDIVSYGYTDDLPNEIAFHEWDAEEWQCWKPNVTAWMPRPKAYKAESENAIEFSEKDAIKMLESKMDGHTDTSYEWAETVRISIKALKQGPILDKIRAEIEQMPSELTADGRRMIRRESVFRIIDKYKAESEAET